MRLLIFAALLLAAPVPAKCWDAQVEGPDVFGNVKVVASEARSLSEGLVVQCDSKGELLLAYIFRKKEFEAVSTAPATLLVSTEANKVLTLRAELRDWNDNYAGIVASEVKEDIISAIVAIQTAKAKIEVGVEINGNQISGSFGSRGSSKSMSKVIQNCKLQPLS